MKDVSMIIKGLYEANKLIVDVIPEEWHGYCACACMDAIDALNEYRASAKLTEEERHQRKLESNKRYRQMHPEKCREYTRRWKEKNKDKVSIHNKAYRERHKVEVINGEI